MKSFTERQEFWDATYDFDASADKEAKLRGLVTVYPKENELQFDIDSLAQLQDFRTRLERFMGCTFDGDNRIIRLESEKPSASGKPGHVHITLSVWDVSYEQNPTQPLSHPNITPHAMNEWERIALQAVLGSDPMREYLNAMRHYAGNPKPTRLFELPEGKIAEPVDPYAHMNPQPKASTAEPLTTPLWIDTRFIPCKFCHTGVAPSMHSNGIGDYYLRCQCGATTDQARAEIEESAVARWQGGSISIDWSQETNED